jgi:hypothetical protein
MPSDVSGLYARKLPALSAGHHGLHASVAEQVGRAHGRALRAPRGGLLQAHPQCCIEACKQRAGSRCNAQQACHLGQLVSGGLRIMVFG